MLQKSRSWMFSSSPNWSLPNIDTSSPLPGCSLKPTSAAPLVNLHSHKYSKLKRQLCQFMSYSYQLSTFHWLKTSIVKIEEKNRLSRNILILWISLLLFVVLQIHTRLCITSSITWNKGGKMESKLFLGELSPRSIMLENKSKFADLSLRCVEFYMITIYEAWKHNWIETCTILASLQMEPLLDCF